MQKFAISVVFFFALSLAITKPSLAHARSEAGGLPNVDSLLSRLNLDSVLHRVNIDSIMHRVNVDSLMQRVNVDSILHQVNVDSLLGRLNIDSLWKVAKPKLEEMFQSSRVVPESKLARQYAEEFYRPGMLESAAETSFCRGNQSKAQWF